MENNKVTIESIRNQSVDSLKLIAIMISLVIGASAFAIIFSVKMADIWKVYTFGIAFGLVILSFLAAQLLGKTSDFFEKRTALSWYEWDKKRLTLLKEEKGRIRDEFELFLKNSVEKLLSEEPLSKEKTKQSVVNMVKTHLRKLDEDKARMSKIIEKNELEIIRYLHIGSTVNSLQDELTEWLLDFLSSVKKEEINKDLVHKRISEMVRKTHLPHLNDSLRYYDSLIDSCTNSTNDLAVILKQRHGYTV